MAENSEPFDSYPGDIEFYDDEEELQEVLEAISSAIGWIIIEFNSLEGLVGYCIKEQISNANYSDEFVYLMLANVGYSAKYEALMNIYSRIVDWSGFEELRDRLKGLDETLREASRRRNQYAHANWTEISKSNLVGVKLKAGRKGLFQVYRTFTPDEMTADRTFIAAATQELVAFDEDLNEKLVTRSA
jgi:hypothetical protein